MSDPNPFEDFGPFGQVIIADTIIACTLIEVDGATSPEDWSVTKGTGTSGATSSWKGNKPAEKLKLKFRAHDPPSFQAMTDLLLVARPKRGDKPPSLHIENAVVNWGGIGVIALKEPPSPKWEEKSGAWDFEWEWIENDPSKAAATGAAAPASPDAKDPPTAQSAADKEIARLTQEVNKL